MRYRPLGNTGLNVSQLGFGAMRLPMLADSEPKRIDRDKAIPMIHRAFDGGVNYIDTAVGYCAGDSQRVVGEAVASWTGRRRDLVISTKNHCYDHDEKAWWTLLEQSLQRLGVEYIDIYNHHGINWNRYVKDVEPVLSTYMAKARDQGLIRHICCSFHDNNEGLLKLVESGYPEVITLQYNMLDRSLEDGIAAAHEAGIGVVVMGPVAGGRLGADSDVLAESVPGIARVPELAMRFVLANPHVSVALSGMSERAHVEENLAVCDAQVALGDDDRAAIAEHMGRLQKMAELYCTACGYCMPCEPAGVGIPAVFGAYNLGRVYGLWDAARAAYAHVARHGEGRNRTAEACTQCGACEQKCPQNIPIRKQLAEAHDALAAD